MSLTPIVGAALLMLPHHASAGGIVTNATEANLRAAMAGGGTVTFACDGTIGLSNTLQINTDTIMDGAGHQITISGSNSVRVFYVSTNVSASLFNLTIANGRSDNAGGLFNAGGRLAVQNCTFVNNCAIGLDGAYYSGNPGTNASGGAIYNLGVVSSVNCAYISNSVSGGAGALRGSGGPGGAGGNGCGGAVANLGSFTASGCLLANNRANGSGGAAGGVDGSGGAGGDPNGGAIANFGALSVSGCLFMSNSSVGGAGGTGGWGTFFPGYNGTPGGAGGTGGFGNGGALYNNGTAFLVNDTAALNSGVGGQGAAGGQGGPPWNQSTSSGNGGNGGNGGSGFGALSDVSGQCYLTNCTLAFNQAIPGTGGAGGPPGPWPYPYPPHLGTWGTNGTNGVGSAVNTTGACILNTLLATNAPANLTGAIVDAGHNLSSDESVNGLNACNRV